MFVVYRIFYVTIHVIISARVLLLAIQCVAMLVSTVFNSLFPSSLVYVLNLCPEYLKLTSINVRWQSHSTQKISKLRRTSVKG